jgi:Na+/H+ antiporter NhaA
MQRIATRVFVYASVVFGIIGILLVLTIPGKNQPDSSLNIFFIRLLMACVFIILPSFALSVAGKYLNGKK